MQICGYLIGHGATEAEAEKHSGVIGTSVMTHNEKLVAYTLLRTMNGIYDCFVTDVLAFPEKVNVRDPMEKGLRKESESDECSSSLYMILVMIIFLE